MKPILDNIVDPKLQKYGVPEWTKPYIYDYIKRNPINTVKFATSFIEIKRRKGEVTKKYVRLPNGMTFKLQDIIALLNLFYHGEDCMAQVASRWSRDCRSINPECSAHFANAAAMSSRHTRAIKNLIEGLGHRVGDLPTEIKEVFDYVAGITPLSERIITSSVLLRDSYANTIGQVFYRVFYPASPEFMRSFRKAFTDSGDETHWEVETVRGMISAGEVDSERLSEIARGVLARVYKSFEANMKLARSAKIVNEAKLLRDIAIEFPFHTMADLGIRLNIAEEVKRTKQEAARLG